MHPVEPTSTVDTCDQKSAAWSVVGRADALCSSATITPSIVASVWKRTGSATLAGVYNLGLSIHGSLYISFNSDDVCSSSFSLFSVRRTRCRQNHRCGGPLVCLSGHLPAICWNPQLLHHHPAHTAVPMADGALLCAHSTERGRTLLPRLYRPTRVRR